MPTLRKRTRRNGSREGSHDEMRHSQLNDDANLKSTASQLSAESYRPFEGSRSLALPILQVISLHQLA